MPFAEQLRAATSANDTAPPRSLDALLTPAAVVDLDIMDSNLDRMATYARDHDLALRPPATDRHRQLASAAPDVEHAREPVLAQGRNEDFLPCLVVRVTEVTPRIFGTVFGIDLCWLLTADTHYVLP